MLAKIENKLDELFVKKAPFRLPEESKKTLVQYMPWVSLAVGVLFAWLAWTLYNFAVAADSLAGYFDAYHQRFGYAPVGAPGFGPVVWLGLLIVIVQAIASLAAFSPLKMQKKRGWDLLFWAALLNIVYALASLFIYPTSGFGNLLFGLVGSTIGLYLLFQIRSYYVAGSTKKGAAKTPARKK